MNQANKILKWFVSDSFIVSLAAIVLGLLLGAVVMLVGGYNPIEAYAALVTRVFGSAYGIGEMLRETAPLLLTGLAVAFAFRAGMFNIGAEGQVLMGMTGASIIAITLPGIPTGLHMILAVIFGALFGGVWAGIAGFLKAKRGVNEVITTIMLNWIALFLSNYIVRTFLLLKGDQRSENIPASASASIDWLSSAMNNARVHWGIPVAFLAAVFFYYFLWKTKQGFELRAVGSNADAAHYAGINVGRNIVKAMFISGVFAGLAGAFEVLGVFHYQAIYSASPGYGFNGIAVALLGMNHPFGVMAGAALFGTLSYGSGGMSFEAGVPPEIIQIVIGSIIFFIAAQGIVRFVIKPFYGKRKKEKVL
ncbi:ABC transporter permease [Saccharibacillus sp. CPCC 101409]|uniref:ABC transporter permease n=1 Tax=Saccharibacillus sp. CPCC 101409 TaxID=3058041 RepID=UPI002671EC64|nr:ABC transporter permease [Saccharibacillus sp. CPCC 101409]MDO3408740.1 ABC transporter permease [Saccharibacillus sp. CPCC 101409]